LIQNSTSAASVNYYVAARPAAPAAPAAQAPSPQDLADLAERLRREREGGGGGGGSASKSFNPSLFVSYSLIELGEKLQQLAKDFLQAAGFNPPADPQAPAQQAPVPLAEAKTALLPQFLTNAGQTFTQLLANSQNNLMAQVQRMFSNFAQMASAAASIFSNKQKKLEYGEDEEQVETKEAWHQKFDLLASLKEIFS
jgi:hypothetical protein